MKDWEDFLSDTAHVDVLGGRGKKKEVESPETSGTTGLETTRKKIEQSNECDFNRSYFCCECL